MQNSDGSETAKGQLGFIHPSCLCNICLLYATNSFGHGEEEEAAQCSCCCPWLLLLLYKTAVELHWYRNTLQIYFSCVYRQLQYWILIGELSVCLQPVFFLACLRWFADTPAEKCQGCLHSAGWGEAVTRVWEQGNFWVFSVGASGATWGTVRLVAWGIHGQINFL